MIAARAVSHDESVRSTLCMQRAAKAVAIEDERMHLDSLEFKKAVSHSLLVVGLLI